MNKIIIGIITVVIGVFGYIIINQGVQVEQSPNMGMDDVVCAEEVMQCPDGSYVGRIGSDCEFAKCSDNKMMPVELNNGIGDGAGPLHKFQIQQ